MFGRAFATVVLFCLFSLGMLSLAWAQVVFGPKQYIRAAGPPQIITDTLNVADPGLTYSLLITSNSLTDAAAETVADSFIYLNDNPVVGTHNFNQGVNNLEVPVTLQAENKLEVEVRGVEGGAITIQIVTTP